MVLPQVLAMSRRNMENNNNTVIDNSDADTSLNFGDDENMVSSSNGIHGYKFQASLINREKHLRYRTRLFAAEYVLLN